MASLKDLGNRVKGFLDQYSQAYQKVSPYVPFAPKIADPKKAQEAYSNFIAPIVKTTANSIKPLVDYVDPRGYAAERSNPNLGTQKLLNAAKAEPMAALNLYGLSRMRPVQTAMTYGVGGGINYLTDLLNKKDTSKSFNEGGKRALEAAPTISAISSYTNPLIGSFSNNLSSLATNPLAKQVISRLATGAGNIPEGYAMTKGMGAKYDPSQALYDFASGTLFGSPTGSKVKGSVESDVAFNKARELEMSARNDLEKLKQIRIEHPDWVDTNNVMKNLQKTIDDKLQQAAEMRKGAFSKVSMGFVDNAQKQKPFNAQEYVQEQVKKQQTAGEAPAGSKSNMVGNFLNEIKKKFVDSTAPIEDAVNLAEKQGKYKILPKQDIRLQIDRVLKSQSLASQFAKDNGLVDAIQKAPDLNALNQYMIAKQAVSVSGHGIETGRNLEKDRQLVQALGPQYDQVAQQVNQYSRKLLDYSVQNGLISKDLAQQLVQKYPDYVPLQRVFNDLEKGGSPGGLSGQIASLGSQTVVKKIKGSEREIANPIESLLLKTQDAFNQGERNKAAAQLASYKDLPGFQGLIQEVKGTSNSPHTFSFLDNGVKRTFQTTPEIAEAAKHLNVEHMNILGKILSYPTRVLQAGATGLNIPFVIRNVLKDQLTSFVNSDKAASTSLLNPVNFLRSLYSAVSHDKLYDEVVRNAAGGTSFDIAREAPNLTVAKIRSERSAGSKIAYTVTHPEELLRAVEDIIGRSEELGRIQNYRGMKEGLLKQGRTAQDAELLAAQAARNNTANFARRGQWGSVLNGAIPFFNAGIQGARQLVDSFQRKPVATTAKVTATVFLPIAYATFWNMSDPQRKAAYQDIPDYEKENNLIFIPPNPTKDEKGRWNVIKIPIPPGLSNLGNLVRRPIEATHGLDPVKFSEIANNLFTAGTSIDTSSPSKLLSSVTPQALKVPLEAYTNTNLFTGQKIVPDSMKNLPPEFQAKDNTSGTARIIGGKIGASPLMVENAIKTGAGGLGSQLLNASDTVLNKAGVIPSNQVGGETIGQNISRSFTKAAGGVQQSNDYNLQDIQTQIKAIQSGIVNGTILEDKGTAAISQLQSQLDTKLKGIVPEGQTTEQYLYRKNLEMNIARATDPIEKYKAQLALDKYDQAVKDGKNPIKSRYDTELSQLRSAYFALQKDSTTSSADKQALYAEIDRQYQILKQKAANAGVTLDSYTVKKSGGGGRRGPRKIRISGGSRKSTRSTVKKYRIAKPKKRSIIKIK